MALAYLKVVGVVGRGDLDDTGTEFTVYIFISHNGDLAVHEGQPYLTADHILITVIFGMDRDRCIAQHGLGTGGGEFQESGLRDAAVLFDQGIFDMPEMAGLVLILDFGVGNGGLADRAPVDDAAALVDPSFFVHLDEDFLHRVAAAFIHGKTLSVPVTGGTQLLELVDDTGAVFFPPVPALLQEAFSSQRVLVDSLFLQGIDDLDLGGDGRVVGPGLPEGIISLHPLEADQDILHGIVQGMAHMELAGDIGRGDDDRKGLFTVVNFRVEVLFVLPVLINTVLDSLGIVGLG